MSCSVQVEDVLHRSMLCAANRHQLPAELTKQAQCLASRLLLVCDDMPSAGCPLLDVSAAALLSLHLCAGLPLNASTLDSLQLGVSYYRLRDVRLKQLRQGVDALCAKWGSAGMQPALARTLLALDLRDAAAAVNTQPSHAAQVLQLCDA